ncbi:MAG: FAD:protein FMN transferase [Chloroflexales bacterium]|nr:FAD:protein FMN transferase [Chloroflexales bacterium]
MTLHHLEFRAMGCKMLAVLDSSDPRAVEQLDQVLAWFSTWEQCLSRFRADSELVQLNARAGQTVQVSEVLWQVIQVARWAAQHSDGLVTPTLLGELEAAGYVQSFEEHESWPEERPSADRVAQQSLPQSWRAIRVDPRRRTICVPPGMRLDLGGVAKGWAVATAARRLSAYGPVLIDAGGDIAMSGPQADGSPWPIGVANPADPDTQLELLLIERGGIATSGRDYRRWQQNGAVRHHIIDPRTGRPAETDVLSATIIAPNIEDAEVAAKTALILGSRAGLAWIEARPSLAGLLVLEHGDIVQSRHLKRYLWTQ